MHSRSRGLHRRPSAQVKRRRGERLEAGGSTCEQNALPFRLPSWNTANPGLCCPFAASNADLPGAAGPPAATQPSLRDVTGSLGLGAPDPPIWSTRPMIDSLFDRTQIRRICAPTRPSAMAWLIYGHAADRPVGAGARHTGGHFRGGLRPARRLLLAGWLLSWGGGIGRCWRAGAGRRRDRLRLRRWG
jgi:hypothetical protein